MLEKIRLFLQGKKTYLIALAMVVVAGLSYFKVIPDVDTLVATLVGVAGIAVTIHAAVSRVVTDVLDAVETDDTE